MKVRSSQSRSKVKPSRPGTTVELCRLGRSSKSTRAKGRVETIQLVDPSLP